LTACFVFFTSAFDLALGSFLSLETLLLPGGSDHLQRDLAHKGHCLPLLGLLRRAHYFPRTFLT
jgi:hypothetical protein